MRRLFSICLLVLSAAALLTAAPATAAKRQGPTPKITRVTPMRISVGNVLTIRGRNFKPKRSANTVIFRSASGRTAFAKPRRASRTKLVLVVPEAVSRLLNVTNSRQRPTRLKLRVLAGRFSAYTPRRLSPVVTGVGEGDGHGGPGGGDGAPGAVKVCQDDADHDNDLLPNDVEKQLGTDPCLEDTDGDAMTDGWEHYSAQDLTIKSVPYPGKRPFPNALDPTDGGPGPSSAIDFDGDGLTTREEYRLWRYTGSSFDAAKAGGTDLESPLGYSDGTKFSRASEAPGVPAWRSASYGLANPAYPFPATYKMNPADPRWRDNERDADADGLSNWLESAGGPGRNDYWHGFWAQEIYQIDPWPAVAEGCSPAAGDPGPQEPGYFEARPFAQLDLADPDVDGDTLLDGEDDQDSDDYSNIVEIYELLRDMDGDGNAVCTYPVIPTIDLGGESWIINPFNPCAPDRSSRTCADFKPFE
jgi:IPT/TIG domain